MTKNLVRICLLAASSLSFAASAADYSPDDLLELAQTPAVVTAMKEFSAAFPNVRAENGISDIAEMKSSVRGYFEDEFGKTYLEKTGKAADIDAIFDGLDDDTIALQYYYISANPKPLGAKDELARADDKSRWSDLHEQYHPLFREHLQNFGLYDVFLVDLESGKIVYSVFKELDFATSLLDGPYSQTPIADVFRNIREAEDPDDADISGREPYLPSYEADAVFASAPIFDGDEQVGVVISQVPFE